VKRNKYFLPAIGAILILASAALWIIWGTSSSSTRVLKYEDVLALPAAVATYHSINNWQTVEDTAFQGAPLYELLERNGVSDLTAQMRIISPDGYFWPAVDTTLTLEELRSPNPLGLYTILAYKIDGSELQAEPDGTGPLRLVMPQYEEGQVNKPSWVSNVRLIEVGPLSEDFKVPDAASVPYDEVWLYGNLPQYHNFPIWPAIACLAAGLMVLALSLLQRRKPAATILLLLMLTAGLVLFAATPAKASGETRIFTLADLQAMPSFSGHYTFLKSQEPFTYYEEDYTGVPLSYLLGNAMTLGAGATGITVRARDGYKVSLGLDQVRKTYPGGLKAIVAYAKRGQSLEGDEGPLRLIVPQENPGNKEQGGDANTPACERMAYAVEVAPMPSGMAVPASGEVAQGSLAIYGSVSVPAQTKPQPDTPDQSDGGKKSDTPATTTTTPAETQAVQAATLGPLPLSELLRSPVWGNLYIIMRVFGGSGWSYPIPYLELTMRAGTK
jgi:DMSO/TMAO reductase YedYZ molybdopterin-dependent catalytic subunit